MIDSDPVLIIQGSLIDYLIKRLILINDTYVATLTSTDLFVHQKQLKERGCLANHFRLKSHRKQNPS